MTVKIVLKDEEKDDGKLMKLPSKESKEKILYSNFSNILGCFKLIGTGLSIAENPLGTTSKSKTMVKIE
jgi:hypothetical protein